MQKRHSAPCKPLTILMRPKCCGVLEAELQAASFNTGTAPCGLGSRLLQKCPACALTPAHAGALCCSGG